MVRSLLIRCMLVGVVAVVLWHFRDDSLTMQIILWTVLGLGFGALTERSFVASGLYRPRLSPKLVWR